MAYASTQSLPRWLDGQGFTRDTADTTLANGSNGTNSLCDRLLDVARHYYADEKPELDARSFSRLIVRSLISYAISAINAVSAISYSDSLTFTVGEILGLCRKVDSNILLSTMSGIFLAQPFQHMG